MPRLSLVTWTFILKVFYLDDQLGLTMVIKAGYVHLKIDLLPCYIGNLSVHKPVHVKRAAV